MSPQRRDGPLSGCHFTHYIHCHVETLSKEKKRSMAQSLRFDASTRCIEPQTLEGVLFLVIYFDFMEDTTLHVGQCGPFHKLMGYSVIHIMANMNSIPVVNYYYWNQQNFPVCGISLGLPIPMTTPNYTSISLYQLTWAANSC